MKTYKLLAAGLAIASLMSASVASAQVATSTSPTMGSDLAVSIGGSGITLSAAGSATPVRVTGLPFSIGGGVGGTCTLMNGSSNLGTVGGSLINFNNAVVIPAGGSVTLAVNCTGSTPGTYPVTLA